MALNLGIKSSGQLSSTQGTLFKVNPGQSASVKVNLTNTASTTIKVNLWLKDGSSTARLISPKDLELQAKHSFSTCYHELGELDSIEGKAAVSGFIDYSITGFVKT
jgi:hypothetical protein